MLSSHPPHRYVSLSLMGFKPSGGRSSQWDDLR
jgi:hypothetical protein